MPEMIYNVTDQAQKLEGKPSLSTKIEGNLNLSWDLQKIEGKLKLS